jgi:hypothetical protein
VVWVAQLLKPALLRATRCWRQLAFVSADNDDAKVTVSALLDNFGYAVIDLGNLRDGGLIQQAGGPLAGRELFEGER